MKESDIIATMTVHYTSEGEGQVAAAANTVTAAQDKVAASSNALATVTETTARRQASAAAAFNAMAKAMDPAARAFDALERNQNTFGRAMSANSGILDKAGQSLAVYRDKLDAAAVAAENLRRQQANASVNLGTGFNPSAAPTASYAAMFGNLLEIAEGKARQAGQAFGASLDESMIAGVAKSARDSASVFTADLDRLESIAQAKAMQAGQQFGTSLNENMIAGVSKSAKDSASVFTAEMDRLDTITQQKAMQIGKNFQDDLNKSFGIGIGSKSARDSSAVFEEAAKAQDDMAASALRLRTAINPLEAEQGRLAAELKQYKVALDAGAISQQEFAAAHAMAGKRLQDFAQNLKVAGTAGRVMSGEMTNLGFQLNDVVTGLALGQSPFMILAQQGGQIIQIFANSKSSIADFASSSLRWLGSLISPMTVLATGAVAATAAVAALALQYDKLQVSSQRALIGAGARTGTTVDDLNKFTEQNSGTLGTNFTTGLSTKEARGFGEELTKTGEIVISRLHGMSDAVVGFANQTGMSMEEARKALVGIAVDPKKGLEELAKTFGAFDVATRQAVEELVRADDKTGAFQVTVDAISDKLKTAAENMNVAEKAARGLVNTLAVSQNPTGLEQQLEAARQRVVAAMDTPTGGLGGGEDARAAAVERATKAYHDLNAEIQKRDALTAKATVDKLSTDADNAVKAITTEINAIDQLKDKIEQLNRAKASGVTSKFGGAADDAALQQAQNQLAALEQSQAQAARYAIEVANISTSWGNVGQAVALQLQAMQNALPVAREWTEAGKMKAQYEATYLDLLNKGATQQEAQAVAAKQEEVSKAAAVASAQKLVQSSQDNLNAIKAQGTGMEDVLASSVAYRDAIQAGATATQAASIAANTLSAGFERAAQAAQQMAQAAANSEQQSYLRANGFDSNGNLDPSRFSNTAYHMPTGPLTFAGSTDAGANELVMLLQQQAATEKAGIGGLAGTAYGTGGVDAAIAAIKNAPGTFGAPSWMNQFQSSGGHSSPIDYTALLGSERSTTEDKISNYDQIVQLQNAMTNDKGTQVANLKAEMDWLQTLPETISRDQKIISLQQSIDSLKNATDANTAATQATLNPLYSQGHGALAIGYYKAATGLEGIVGGHGGTDSTEVRMMLTPGEHIKVTPQAQSSNDNSRQTTVIQNFYGQTTSNERRSRRQGLQGFAQSIAAAG